MTKVMDAISYHKKYNGKIGTELKSPINTKPDLSLAYTPGVAKVCEKIHKNPRKAGSLTLKGKTVAVVSDGSAVLGLGNIGGLASIPVMEGKAALFKKFGGVDAFPICLDTQDTKGIISIIKNIAPSFGGINLEDISAPRCFEIEKILKKELSIPVMHDDQHGTAVVVLAALINALKVVGKKKEGVKIVVNGAGAAGLAVSDLLLKYGFKNLIICDSKGAIYKNRKDLNLEKQRLSKFTNKENIKGNIHQVIKDQDVFIGVSKGNLINKEDIKNMNNDPIVFAMANPTPEIMPDIAKKGSAKIVATGRSDFDNQINNVLAFPGIFKGALENNVKEITDEMLIAAAKKLASLVKKPTAEKIIPSPFEEKIAESISKVIKN